MDPTKIEKWAVVNFSARCDIRNLVRDLIKCGGLKGIVCFNYFIIFIICCDKHFSLVLWIFNPIFFLSKMCRKLMSHLMCLKKVLRTGGLHLSVELRKCLTSYSQNFLVLLSSFCACSLRERILIFTVRRSISSTFIYH